MSRLAIALGAAPVLVLSLAAAAQAPAAAGNVENGKRLFEKDGCYECHGFVGQGSRDGARIAATTMNTQAFIRYVRRPFGAMPAFTEKVMSDQELTDVHAYLKSLPAAKAPRDIPLLDRLREK
ncbi:MAG TPA: cytochrome c [Vicinamibacterales bacterium]|nr:cytochrome c [Vicinamibacterales bacterium]